ncbi:MAG: Dabb family protein [Candidatus Hydrogenedentes bacterium]|nr:Dabb family protein [Candidatus Hydrogenedentota bacterium]
MLVHSVFFWIHADRTAQQREDFRHGLESLRAIEHVRALYVGVPANTTPRPVIERGYAFALTVVFDDVAGHDAYQVHPVHKEFLARFASYWSRVQIYDAE